MRRFITFIDCAYEHKVKLIITAYAKHPDDLLVVADAKSFERDAETSSLLGIERNLVSMKCKLTITRNLNGGRRRQNGS